MTRPEIFVMPSRGRRHSILLPYGKVLEQFHNFQVRDDQNAMKIYPQKTRFAGHDRGNERFGTAIAPLETSTQPR